MKKLILILVIALTACTDGIPAIKDLDNITVDGQTMTASEFYKTYCTLKPSHETCIAVKQKQEMDLRKSATQSQTNHKW